MIRHHIDFALSHPVFDPIKQILPGHGWLLKPDLSVVLTVNIGME